MRIRRGVRGVLLRRSDRGLAIGIAVVAATVAASELTLAQQATSLDGPPVQVIPMYPEPGAPQVTITPGTQNPFAGADGGSDGGGSTGLDGGGVGAGGAAGGDGGPVLSTLMSQSFGTTAINEAQGLGVNASALAGQCVLESQCANIPNSGGGSATGPWQMMPSTFQAMYSAAVAEDPSLQQNTTGSITDPASEAAAAAELMKREATTLQNAGISNPTLMDVRGGYAFGDTHLAQVAQAPDDEPLGQILPSWSQSTWAANGLTPETTVGQWRFSITSKIGSAANQPVFN